MSMQHNGGRPRRVTMMDVAREADISRGTVSRFLNDTSYVSPEAREAIKNAIKRVGYVPNAAARFLAGSPTRNVALVIHEEIDQFGDDPNLAGMMTGANRRLAIHKHQLLILIAGDDEAIGRLELTLAGGLIDAVMLASTKIKDPLIDLVRAMGIPAAIVGQGAAAGDIPVVDVDNEHGAHEITMRLLATGRKKVAMVAGPENMHASLDRVRGFKVATGQLFDAQLVVHTADWGYEAGRAAMEQLLHAHPDIDGVFGANDAIAAGIIDALLRAGRSVPQDVGVVGYDNTRWAEYSHPRLSTVAQPAEALGERMADFVIRQLNGEDLTGAVALERTHVIWRASA